MEKYLWDAKIRLSDGRTAELQGNMTLHTNLQHAERELFYKLDDEFQRKVGVAVSSIDVDWTPLG
jgi:hypothetical protein